MKKGIVFTVLFCLTFISGRSANKADSLFRPDLIHIQYAGNVGLGGLGLGYLSKDEFHYFGIGLGYLPKSVHRVEVGTLFLKYACKIPARISIGGNRITPYFGSNVNFAKAHNTYLKYPGYFPDDYYHTPNAIHFGPFLGAKWEMCYRVQDKNRKVNLHCEMGTVEYKLWHAVVAKSVYLYEIWSLAFGVSFPIQ